MVSAKLVSEEPDPIPNPNPNPKNTKRNIYHIAGIQVEFPYQPYGTQLAFMCRVISTLDRAQRDGRCHALLESPTGTGKSLSLLCSALAWQQNYESKLQNANLSHSKAAPEAVRDPLNHGGGFLPETQPSTIPPSGNPEPVQAAANKRPKIPTIYYSSRTHSQISQVIREYRKTAYRTPMAVLASRKNYCINPYVKGKDNVDEECKLLLKDKRNIQCSEFKNVHKVVYHPSLQKGGYNEVHDIEDLVKVGQVVKGCPYYAAQSMSEQAQLVFCPYSYIINPVIRGAMEIDIKGAIIIFDEAHNMEDIARDAGSVDIEEDTFFKLQAELEQLSFANPMIYQPLCEMIQELISWIGRRKDTLEKREFQHYFSSWTGDKALRELQESNITQNCFPILLECATKAIKASKEAEAEPNMPHLSGLSILTLEELFAALTYFFSRSGSQIFDYQLGLQRYIKRDAKNVSGSWTHTLSLWCLNPAVVFKDIADLSLSIILTSGTLSPMNSFSSELGVQFGTCLEAPHVIDVDSQVWTAVIPNGPGNYPLNASYKTADAYEFQDALGKTLEEICKIVPGGSLVFFPSYKLMDKLCSRWRETGQWSRLSLRKYLFVEPKGGQQDEFDSVLKGFYDSIQGKKPTTGRKRRVKKTELDTTDSQYDSKKGAAFFAVCRGKVSEGIDFTDDNARAVIVVGIPFPNINDIQVRLKKKYNDTYKTSKNLLSGSEWYCQQAFRALNQAAGRCIRHRFDYGAIIFLDQRYMEERNMAYISKWLRQSIKQYDNFAMALEGLRSFFKDVKEHVGSKIVGMQDHTAEENLPLAHQSKDFTSKKTQKLSKPKNSGSKDKTGSKVVDVECIIVEDNNSSVNGSNGPLQQKNQKLKDSEHSVLKQVSIAKFSASIAHLRSQGHNIHPRTSIQTKENIITGKEDSDQGCSFQADSRCCETSSMTFSCEDPDIHIVKESPGAIYSSSAAASPCSFSKNGSSSPTITQASAESPDQLLQRRLSLPEWARPPSKVESSMTVTPERDVTRNTCSLMIPEVESSLNLSVNSHAVKRRKSSGSPFIDLVEEENCDVPSVVLPERMSLTRRIEFGLERDCKQKSKESNALQLLEMGKIMPSAGPAMDRMLRISCLLCRSPLGLPEKHLYVNCSLTSSSKLHLLSLLKESRMPVQTDMPPSIPVLLTDNSSVDRRLWCRTVGGAEGQGIWCEQDGCVFNNIFCPFCSTPNNCLGVQIMATDSANVQLLNKILIFADRLEIGNPLATEDKVLNQKDALPATDTEMSKSDIFKSIEKFSYSPIPQGSGGWRITKSKLRLPKQGLVTKGKYNGDAR